MAEFFKSLKERQEDFSLKRKLKKERRKNRKKQTRGPMAEETKQKIRTAHKERIAKAEEAEKNKPFDGTEDMLAELGRYIGLNK